MRDGILKADKLPEHTDVLERIDCEIKENDIVLYLKGSKSFPQCGYSAAVVEILNSMGVPYKDVDVLSDPSLCKGVKEYANWPNTPQLYVKGRFVGDCDRVRKIHATGELQSLLKN